MTLSSEEVAAKAAKRAGANEAVRKQAAEDAPKLRAKAEQEATAKLKTALAKLKVTTDKLEGTKEYASRQKGGLTGIRCFFRQKDGAPPQLFVEISYSADEWLFIQAVNVYADGAKFPYEANVKRDHGSGIVFEWATSRASEADVAMLEAVASAKEADVRFKGRNFSKDFTIPSSQKRAIRDVLEAFYAFRALFK